MLKYNAQTHISLHVQKLNKNRDADSTKALFRINLFGLN